MFELNHSEEAEPLLDSLVNEAVRSLRKTLADEGRESLAVLIDPALSNPVLPLIEKYDLPVTRLSLPYGDVDPHIQPYLVSIDNEPRHERFVNETVAIAVQESLAARDAWPAARSVSAWLMIDDAAMGVFSQRFRANAVIPVPGNASQRRLLRFWDPRVLPQLARIVGKDAWRHWLPVNAVWLSIDGWGQMSRNDFANPTTESENHWQPDKQAWQALERIADVNHSMVMGGTLHQTPDVRKFEHVDRLLLRATQLGCTEALDRVTYAVLIDAMRLPLEQHPQIAVMLERTRREGVSFSDLLSTLEPTDWERIRDDLMRTTDFKTSPFFAQE